ncbi:GntR family transcriptional regulator [Rummeliibacillus sp. NPDC094406]|uniref:GntR family transcriptional regulator n=1 Tax=Rummeliibacillus sp. NPDC094406 TaxID=3364511 RepID=UPI003818D3DE
MHLNSDGTKPIYVQIADWIENEIIADHLKPDDKVYSQYQLAELFNINPATAGKGLSILLEEQIVYKKRGLGMFVTTEAKQVILAKRKNEGFTKMIDDIVLEAKRLKISEDEIINFIKKSYREEC